MTKQEWLAEECCRLKHGECRRAGCLERGGYQRGQGPVDPQVATCIPYEIAQDLQFLERLYREYGLVLTQR